MFFTRRFCLVLLLALGMVVPGAAWSCPFCAAVSLTFSEEIGGASAAVIAKMTKPPAISKKPKADAFGAVPFSGVKELKDKMKHDQIVGWIKDQKVPVSRRRLYLTMLGVCGTPQDAAMLEELIRSDDRQAKAGLDALVAAYLSLKGPD